MSRPRTSSETGGRLLLGLAVGVPFSTVFCPVRAVKANRHLVHELVASQSALCGESRSRRSRRTSLQNGVMVDLGRKEVALSVLAGVTLAIAMTWPLAIDLWTDVGKDLGDPLLQAWQVAWIGHALVSNPLDLWQANTFWPLEDALAFSDALIGYAPAGLAAQEGPHAALVVYNLLFLFAYTLAFVGAYLLARELGTGPVGAVAAGAAFA